MIGHLYTLLFGARPAGPEPEPEGGPPSKEVYGSGRGAADQRITFAMLEGMDQHTQHGNEAAIRFVIALAISGED